MRFSAQTWTAFVSALVFVGLAAVVALAPVPYVTWSPGQTHDVLSEQGEPVVSVQNMRTYPTTGTLELTTVSVTRSDARLSLPEALAAFWLPGRDTLPRESVYRPGRTAEEVQQGEQRDMADSKTEAVVAALRQDQRPVRELPMVSSVVIGSPAQGQLLPGDLIEEVDGESVRAPEAIRDQISTHRVGEKVAFTLLRAGERQRVTVTTIASKDEASVPVVGVTFDIGYDYSAQVSFGIDPQIGGPSAGLVFSLAVYDLITPVPLLGERKVAATGTIDADGRVGSIGGAQQKVTAAEESGADIFLIPRVNCADLAGMQTSIPIVNVSSLDDAVRVLQLTKNPATANDVDRCRP